jgi:hypothetical protein
MARQLSDVVYSGKLYLNKWDPDGDEYVVFQQPSRLEQETIDAMQAQSELVFNTEERGKVTQRDRMPMSKIESEMVAMCLVECSIKKGDEPIFVPGRTCREAGKGFGQVQRRGFYKVWHSPDFPPELADEIVEKLFEFYPPFDWRSPERPNESSGS